MRHSGMLSWLECDVTLATVSGSGLCEYDFGSFALNDRMETLEDPGPAETPRGAKSLTRRGPVKQEADQKCLVKCKDHKSIAAKQKSTCPLCKMVMLRKTLARHIAIKHSDRPPLHRCQSCKACFLREDILQRHQHEQRGESPGTVICVHCDGQVRERSLNDHFKSRKCRSAQTLSRCKAAREERLIEYDECHSELYGSNGLNCAHGPLLACARFCVTTWFIYVTLSYNSDDWKHPIISIETSISSRLIPPERVTLLWQSRGAAIASTLCHLSDLDDAEHLDGPEYDHNMMTIALLSAAKDCIFDKRSKHTQYLHAHHKAFRDQEQALSCLRGYLIAACQHVWLESRLDEQAAGSNYLQRDQKDTCLSHLLRSWRCPQKDFMLTLKDCWKNTRRRGEGEVDVHEGVRTERRSCPYWRNRIVSGS